MQTRALSHFSLINPRVVVVLLAAISVVPLLIPAFPPLTDVPGHMGRYAVQLDRATDSVLAGWFSFDWTLIGNLGVDLLVELLGPVFGVQLSVKLITIGIVVLSVTGLMAVQKAASGKIGPTILFALPLIYGFPFQFGFINYCLSMSLMLHALALWIRLGKAQRFGLRALLFVPASLLIWLAHIGGWGALGLTAFAAEFWRLRDSGRTYFQAFVIGAAHCRALIAPALLTIAVRANGAAGDTLDWFHWFSKVQWIVMALKDHWQNFDLWSVSVIGFVLASAVVLPFFRFNRVLVSSAGLMFIAFIFTPRILIGSAYADMRLVPWILMFALLAIEIRPGVGLRVFRVMTVLGAIFFLARTSATTIAFFRDHEMMQAELAALDYIPEHARIVALVGRKCYPVWQLERRTHLPSIAIVRRHAFTNDQFEMAGAQLIGVRYKLGRPFVGDPSQMVTDDSCRRRDWMTYTKAIAAIPKAAFDYVWVIDAPTNSKADLSAYQLVWRHGTSALYKVPQ